MNLLAYSIFLAISYVITVHAGNSFYRNGRIYLLDMLRGDVKITDTVNRVLLVGYYMINLGYVTLMISFWETITDYREMLESVTMMTGKIMLLLAVMHYMNMTVILIYNRLHYKNKLSVNH